MRQWVIIAGILGLLGVALGAFGAQGLEATLEANERVDTFNTASRYHMYHAIALFGVAWLADRYQTRYIQWAGVLMTAGTLIFSGSLYILAIADLGIMGAVAPIGGTALIIAWGLIAYSAWQNQ